MNGELEGSRERLLATGKTVPAIAHFIWYGRSLPWVNVLAVRSALARGEFDRVLLHHSDPLDGTPYWRELAGHRGFEAVRLDPDGAFAPLGPLGRRLLDLHARLPKPAARANVLRAALLAQHGGVYLDMDTVSLKSLAPLRGARPFCGEESIAFPAGTVRLGNPRGLMKGIALHGVRAACRRLPQGVALFQRVAHRYPRGVNNAVLGAPPGDEGVLALLEHMAALPRARQHVRFALGTHALQTLVAAPAGAGVVVHPPEVFYPLGPEISHQWFRVRPRVALDEALSPATRVVHWYASVENRALYERIDPAYVRAHAERQLFSALVRPFV